MSELIYLLVAAAAFILLGRWAYRNPKKIYPNWLYNNPDHPWLIGGVRAFSVMCIFVGSFAAFSAIAEYVVKESFVVVVSLALAIAATWYLRPVVPEQVAQQPPATGKRKPFLSKKGMWVLGISFVAAGAFVMAIMTLIGSSEPCRAAVQSAQSNPAVLQRMGTPVRKGWMVSGSIETSDASGHADLAIPISGPNGKGTIYAIGVKKAGLWTFETLEVAVSGHSDRIDLLKDKSPLPHNP